MKQHVKRMQIKLTQEDLDNINTSKDKHGHENGTETIRGALRVYSVIEKI